MFCRYGNKAFEWNFYDAVLSNVQNVNEEKAEKKYQVFKGCFVWTTENVRLEDILNTLIKMFPLMERPFFNFEFFYQPVNGKFYTKLCPAPVTPKFLIKEEHRKKKHAKDLHYHKQSHSLFLVG